MCLLCVELIPRTRDAYAYVADERDPHVRRHVAARRVSFASYEIHVCLLQRTAGRVLAAIRTHGHTVDVPVVLET